MGFGVLRNSSPRRFSRNFSSAIMASGSQNDPMTPSKKARVENLTGSSLYGPPKKSLVPPGECQYTDTFQSSKLLQKWQVSHSSAVFRFQTPDATKPLNLSTCACILAKAKVNEEDVIRPYTPISTNDLIGCFDLLVKDYAEGKLSRHLNTMKVGDSIDFKHIKFNVKVQAPFPFKKIGMIAGGTGITPMIQALHAILGDEQNSIKVNMLYGSQESSDILGVDLLENWQGEFFKVVHVLSNEPESSDWKGKRGFISKELIQEFMPSPTDDSVCIFVCGPPPLYDAICGPREEEDIKGVLHELGYSKDQVFKF